MAGTGGLPTGFGLSTVGMTGGQANYNPTTTAAVSDASGGLKAFDPTTMHETRAPGPKPDAIARPAGYSSSGLPDWQTNWLQNGGQSTVPSLGQSAPAAQGPGSVNPVNMAPPPPVKKTTPNAGATSSVGPVKGGTAAAPGAAPAATNTGITPINMNWVNNPANLAVADVYNPSQGGSAPGVVQTPGSYNPIQAFIQPNGMMPQFYTDGKGGYFADAAGTKPLDKYTTDYMKQHGIK